jgi:hypothetical protein
MSWLKKKDMKRFMRETERNLQFPVPTRMLTNGEFTPSPQTSQQREVEARLKAKASEYGRKLGMSRREFLQTASGMAAAFLAMNEVFGEYFKVNPAEAADLETAIARRVAMKSQFIFDDQTHHVRDTYKWEGLNFLRDFAKGNNPEKVPWNKTLVGETASLDNYKFHNYLREIFLESDTGIALLSSFTTDTAENAALTNDEMVATRDIVNRIAGTKRMYCHGMFWPPYPGNLEAMERAAQELKVDSWKGYTVGDPLGPSRYPWRMDDSKVTYPAYEKAVKLGIKNICVHKGLMPDNYEKAFEHWRYATVEDLGKCAQDWPQLNFIIYHAGLRPLFDCVQANADFEKSGKLPWIDELAEIPSKFGVSNVYGEIGSAFGMTAVTYPKMTAYLMGRLVKGMGSDHVVWGTDSIWYGSPQWQLEAMRRLEIPADMQKKYGFKPLGGADGDVKKAILAYNSARLYSVDMTADGKPVTDFQNDGIARLKADYEKAGADRMEFYANWFSKLNRDEMRIASGRKPEFGVARSEGDPSPAGDKVRGMFA